MKKIEKMREEIIAQNKDTYALNDRGHQEPHFEATFQCGMEIADKFFLVDENLEKLILFTAYYCDMFAAQRENHHVVAHDYVMSGKCPIINKYLNMAEVEVVAKACLEHRASYEGEFSSLFSELMSSADREAPKPLHEMIHRAALFRRDRNPDMSEEEVMKGAVEHIKEKYGTKGYARYPDMYIMTYENQLRELQKKVDCL